MVTDRTQLHTAQEHGDGSILKHVNELIDSLEAKGINPILRDEQGDPCPTTLSWGTDAGKFKFMDSPGLKRHTSTNLDTGSEHCGWRLEISMRQEGTSLRATWISNSCSTLLFTR